MPKNINYVKNSGYQTIFRLRGKIRGKGEKQIKVECYRVYPLREGVKTPVKFCINKTE